MKLLLTSGGITNQAIAEALFDLVGKKPKETIITFIPTASNVEIGDKDWLITDLLNLKKQKFKSIEITDISAVEEKIWRPSLERADVLFFEGGNTWHLMQWLNKSGLAKMLPKLLKDKVYVGVSAGSMILSKDIAVKLALWLYEEESPKVDNIQCLDLVDFYFLPHLNSPYFKFRKDSFIRDVTKDITEKIYVVDDQSALKIIDGKIEVVSQGKWFVLN